jgi:hypothetical protein
VKIVKLKIKIKLKPQNPSTRKVTEIKEDYSESLEKEDDNPELDDNDPKEISPNSIVKIKNVLKMDNNNSSLKN